MWFQCTPGAWVASSRRTISWTRGWRSGCSKHASRTLASDENEDGEVGVEGSVPWGSRGTVKVDGCLGRLREGFISFIVKIVLQLNHGVTVNRIDDEHGYLQLSGCVYRVAYYHIFALSKGCINLGVADGRRLIQRRPCLRLY